MIIEINWTLEKVYRLHIVTKNKTRTENADMKIHIYNLVKNKLFHD